MADIRKRTGAKGTTYQVRYPSEATRSGYTYATFTTLKDARHFIESGKAQARSALQRSQEIPVSKAVDLWLEICEKEGRNGRAPVTTYTLKNYRYRGDIINRYPWEKPIQRLVSSDAVAFRSWLLRNYSRAVAQKVLLSFHSIVLELVSRDILGQDFVAGISISNSLRYREPINPPTIYETQELLAAADRLAGSKNLRVAKSWRRYRPMLYLAVDSGMRPQEYIVLARSSVNAKGVFIDRALERGGYRISATKTPAGRRFIDLSNETLDMVRHYADNHAVTNEHDLVFPTDSGHWQSTDNWRARGFAAACLEAGLIEVREKNGKKIEQPKFTPYDLRHFYASMLIEQGVNLKRIQKLMGHEDIQTTLNVYGHLIERAEDTANAVGGLLNSLGRKPCGKSVARELEAADNKD